jgi:uncharacterized protein HemY
MAHAAIATGAHNTASQLYTLLMPFADRNASTAGAISFGSASLILGQLATYLGDVGDAKQHYESALAFNIRTRQRTWVAHTRMHYARLLEQTGEAATASELSRIGEADARELGLRALLPAP